MALNKIKRFLKNYLDKRKVRKQTRFITLGKNSKVYPTAVIANRHHDKSLIRIGKHTHVKGNLELLAQGGEIEIGDYCYIGEDTRIWGIEKISIGNRVLIAHNVNIHDNNSHPIDSDSRHLDYKRIIGLDKSSPNDFDLKPSAVRIKDDAWIGFNATILKGVTVGKGAIVGACSLVTKDIPDFAIVVGNPAKIIKYTK